MDLKYKCLILDHDDTAVDSTALIHHAAHLEIMKKFRPEMKPLDIEGWHLMHFRTGIKHYLKNVLNFNEREMEEEFKIWQKHAAGSAPSFYPGFLDALVRYRELGGLITVVSHSESHIVKMHYMQCFSDYNILPDLIFGWDIDEEKRKPSPWPVYEILDHFKLKKTDVLIVDDSKHGVLMSQASDVAIAAAGWCHQIPVIKDYMKANCIRYFSDVKSFEDFILQPK